MYAAKIAMLNYGLTSPLIEGNYLGWPQLAVVAQIVLRLMVAVLPSFEIMGIFSMAGLAAKGLCLYPRRSMVCSNFFGKEACLLLLLYYVVFQDCFLAKATTDNPNPCGNPVARFYESEPNLENYW